MCLIFMEDVIQTRYAPTWIIKALSRLLLGRYWRYILAACGLGYICDDIKEQKIIFIKEII